MITTSDEGTQHTNQVVLPRVLTEFLQCPTPQAWVTTARKPAHLALLLNDHLICELKAAQTAVWLIRKYAATEAERAALLDWLRPYETLIYQQRDCVDLDLKSKNRLKASAKAALPAWAESLREKMGLLIQEELHHFQQVWQIMQQRNIPRYPIKAGRYAKGLMRQVATYEPYTLVDKLICGAFIEARSCERFAVLVPWLDDELGKFYSALIRAEARHYQDYLALAAMVAPEAITERVQVIGALEAELICSPDSELRLHSGVPV